LPHLPTVAEAGVPGYQWIFWYGLMAPAGTPKSIVDKLNTQVSAILKDPQVLQRFAPLGIAPVTSTPQGMDQLVADEVRSFKRIAAGAGIKAD
jgi:tripartite-type tricarboxylate transporter receptor subunit TctC